MFFFFLIPLNAISFSVLLGVLQILSGVDIVSLVFGFKLISDYEFDGTFFFSLLKNDPFLLQMLENFVWDLKFYHSHFDRENILSNLHWMDIQRCPYPCSEVLL